MEILLGYEGSEVWREERMNGAGVREKREGRI